jgi:hypothetical protein
MQQYQAKWNEARQDFLDGDFARLWKNNAEEDESGTDCQKKIKQVGAVLERSLPKECDTRPRRTTWVEKKRTRLR